MKITKKKVFATAYMFFIFFGCTMGQKPGFEKEVKIATGKFKPTLQSLASYEVPDWFRDAKFGIWAHWGAQCAPEEGDWYGRYMYQQPDSGKTGGDYQYQIDHYGHPSQDGFKDVINTWKAENWNPEKLIALYKKAGAKYFVAMANHHDNFDNYASTYQPWNSVNLGPKKDLIDGWAKAARKAGLRFGVSNHSSHAWHWYQVAYGYDTWGPYKNIPYDGWLTKADGKGKWWEGYDPQDLYGGARYAPPKGLDTKEYKAWYKDHDRWYEEIPPNDNGYSLKWFLRTQELVDKYKPDLLYFDDTGLPLEQYGLDIAAHFYNANTTWHNGKNEAVINVKKWFDDKRKSIVLDIERGKNDTLDASPWQTDDCIGQWHYNKHSGYKSVQNVVTFLIDIVSKNGNLMLSIPVRSDGTIDSTEIKFLEGMGNWMDVNSEAIYGTRPWKIYGENPKPVMEESAKDDPNNPGAKLMQVKRVPLSAKNVRYTTKNGNLYVFLLAVPSEDITIRTLGTDAKLAGEIASIQLLGSKEKLVWHQSGEALTIIKPDRFYSKYSVCFKIRFKK